MDAHLLLVDCPDQRGLISGITGVLHRNAFNIISNHEFVDQEQGRFFMRTAFKGTPDPSPIIPEIQAFLPAGAHVRLARSGDRRIVVLVTREHHCLAELLVRHAYGELDATIQAVIGNYDELAPLAEKFDVPFHLVSHENRSREEQEAELHQVIQGYDPDYIVLAKYMRIFSAAFVTRFPDRIINIHHSFLPAFVGARPYQQAFERGVKIIGATAHFVNDDLDEGPIIAQSVIPVDHRQSPADMAQAGRDVEKLVLAKALRLVLEERVFLSGNRTIVFE